MKIMVKCVFIVDSAVRCGMLAVNKEENKMKTLSEHNKFVRENRKRKPANIACDKCGEELKHVIQGDWPSYVGRLDQPDAPHYEVVCENDNCDIWLVFALKDT